MSIQTILEDAAKRLDVAINNNYEWLEAPTRKAILAYEEPSETSDPVVAASWLGKMVEADQPYDSAIRITKPWRGELMCVYNDVAMIDDLHLLYPIRLVKEEAK